MEIEAFVQDASTFHWWLSVVIVGIAINIVSNAIWSASGRAANGAATWWAKRAATEAGRHQSLVQMMSHPFTRAEGMLASVGFLVVFSTSLICATVILNGRAEPAWFRYSISAILLVTAYQPYRSASLLLKATSEATELLIRQSEPRIVSSKDEAPSDGSRESRG